MRPTTTFLIPNVHIYFVFNLFNTTTNTDKRQQKRMSAIMMITAFKGLLYCRNCMESYGQALASLEDILCFFQSEGNSKPSNELAKVISQVQSDWLEHRTSQSRVTDFLPNHLHK